MIIYPAIDLYEGKAVRLFKGDYNQKTVYNDNPLLVADDFVNSGADHIHLVDLEGAKNGLTPNFDVIRRIKEETNLFCEVGGGIRNMPVVSKYLDAGIDRVIIGTAAVSDPDFLKEAVSQYGERIAVGIDIKDGYVAIKGWTEKSDFEAFDFCKKMEDTGVSTIICTDISKDGAMQGTNRQLYRDLSAEFNIDIIASGGVSSIDDIRQLREMNLHGAIIGKAYYTGAIRLKEAIEVAR
ncbi:MAG: 1-(5-phosphoribosyl)-5-[(5-phosphoribosylamino)methylideneamino]imidazole-4-carboxamide isomerase [Clostridiales bacterium]|nr:1-(5-phosphoribosyl)-5-[(5-phosphoribosylamino)methylideneamino]imidazole-4-carboxamide isomerase [Clostridiales bacterium]